VGYNLAEQYLPEMNLQELTDRELVELCLQGNEDAWREFLRRYHRLLAGVAAKTLRRYFPNSPQMKEMVAEVAQDAILRICANNFRALRELEWRHDGALRGLLQITAATAAHDFARKRRSDKWNIDQEKSLEEPGLVIPEKESTEKRGQQKILLEQLVRCLEKLLRGKPDATRDIAMFLLYFGFKVTAADLARLYRMNIRKVENTVARLGRLARGNCL
jgi:DNA-directed RNA polymerase specialized sigma24 family protein